MLNRWSREKMVDAQGRPHFLWDVHMTLTSFEELLRDPNDETRAAAIGKLMRQARPDDVFTFVGVAEMRAEWPRIEPHLGKTPATGIAIARAASSSVTLVSGE